MTTYDISLQDDFRLFTAQEARYPTGQTFWNIRSKTRTYAATPKPNNYWLGDWGEVTFPRGYGALPYGVFGYGDEDAELILEIVISGNTQEYFDFPVPLEYEIPQDSTFWLRKDNIKKDSFWYKERARSDRNNRIRLTYINRNDDYRKDVIEVEEMQDIEKYDEVRQIEYEMTGIKRGTQARRMLAFLIDYNQCVIWECGIETDIVGMFLCLGDIVGISSEVAGWEGKLFRIIGMEEIQDYEVKLDLIEYLPEVYHDKYTEEANPDYINDTDKYAEPSHVRNFTLFEDRDSTCIYLAYSRPETPTKFFAGALFYRYNDEKYIWEQAGVSYKVSPSVKILTAITISDTTINYNDSTMIDSFPSSGVLIVGEELIKYNSIDPDNYMFLDCERGYNATLVSAHDVGEICILLAPDVYKYPYIEADLGKTVKFRAIAYTIFGKYADMTIPLLIPEKEITIHGYYYLPISVGNEKLYLL